MSISKARTVAFDVLLRVAKQNAYADDALRSELSPQINSEDAGLATELVLGSLRWQRLLDFMIDRNLKKAAGTMDIEVRIALRLGVYQILFLDRVPSRAAVHESVELVKRARKRSASTFVNAILRKVAGAHSPAKFSVEAVADIIPSGLSPADRLGISHSHPSWIVERWVQHFGEEKTRELMQANNRAPVASGYLLDMARSDDARRQLEKSGCRIEPGSLLRDAWILQGGNPGANEAVRDGWVAIQDEASQAAAHLLEVKPGDKVLDLCAAPGGKTLLLAAAAGPNGRVIASDLHANRVRAMSERFAASGARNIEAMVLDGAQPLPFDRSFDRILVDVPCSGSGTFSRHPEIKWKLRTEDLFDLHRRQLALLRNALPHLAAGGKLVYSTCSLEPEENESVVREALDETDGRYRIADSRTSLTRLLQPSVNVETLLGTDGFFRTFPPVHRIDGFFAAVIERDSS
jgi:16S rRNA (cytosine967-C5)-methyltransferase